MFETALSITIAALAYCLGRQAGYSKAWREVQDAIDSEKDWQDTVEALECEPEDEEAADE